MVKYVGRASRSVPNQLRGPPAGGHARRPALSRGNFLLQRVSIVPVCFEYCHQSITNTSIFSKIAVTFVCI